LNNFSPVLQVTVSFVTASGGHFQMAFNPANKHSCLKCSASHKNGIYRISKVWGSSDGITMGHRLDTQHSVPSRKNTFFSIP
jgi:hypothetical protein